MQRSGCFHDLFHFLAGVLIIVAQMAATPHAGAQFVGEPSDATAPRLGEPITQRYQAGLSIKAVGGACRELRAAIPVPMDWPEQQVHITDEDVSAEVKSVTYRTTDGTARQMVVEIPHVPSGAEVHAVVTFEISRRTIAAPEKTDLLAIPKSPDREIKAYLSPSPFIESRHAKIRGLAREIGAESDSAWTRTEAIYDYVRENVKYSEGPILGAVESLRQGRGDCEELSSLFIAVCRAAGIPARTVWVPGHCYPEFYLVDEQGRGNWYPCQAAGTRAFGEMPEQRPILQKGDNFRLPERPKERRRYLAERLEGKPVPGGGQPKVRWISELLEQKTVQE